MKQKLFGISVLIAALCLTTACSAGAGTGSSAGSQPDSSVTSSAPADQSAAPQETEPASSADASAPADSSVPAEPATPDSSAPVQEPEEKQEGKPLFTGSFAEGVTPTSDGDPDADSYIQTLQVDGATVVLGRFPTNHSAEAYMDEYNPDEFDVTEKITVAGSTGTHYRWRTGSNEDSTVVDAVVAEADGYSLLFLSRVPQDAYEDDNSEIGPSQATVESWINSLTVTSVQ